MRWRGVNHVELSVLDYENSVAFYDRLFGWLGYRSFETLGMGGHQSAYCMARFPAPHSYIGVQPARSGDPVDFAARPVGLHHLALWAKGRCEVDAFHDGFLLPEGLTATEAPQEYSLYSPGYYASFFDDPINCFHWEIVHIPRLPGWGAWRRWRAAMKAEEAAHTEWTRGAARAAMRDLPGRGD